MRLRLQFLVIGLVVPLTAGVGWSASVPDFCFLQISDIHINPQPVGGAEPNPTDRSVSTIGWFCEQARKPQRIEPFDLTTPEPSFVIATGDLTEYGVINKTWDNFERYFEPLTIPLYLTPGNHDNTWTAMLKIMREGHGGDHYSFDRFGCHFVCIDTATPQEPVPSIDRRTLTWLEEDLQQVGRDTPIFLFCHHPLSSGEFAKPYEQLRLLNVIRHHYVPLLLMGHGHGARHERWGPLDSVMGGSTFGPNTGYNVISVQDGVLRVAYRFRDEAKKMVKLLEKPLRAVPHREVMIHFPITLRQTEFVTGGSGRIHLIVVTTGGKTEACVVTVNDEKERTVRRSAEQARKGTGSDLWHYLTLSTEGLIPGRHFVRATADFGDEQRDTAGVFRIAPPGRGSEVGTVWLPAGIKAQPIDLEDDVIVATTAGQVARVSFDGPGGTVRTLFDAGVEILHAPAIVGNELYFSAAEKGVYSIKTVGTLNWRCDVGSVVYGTPAVGDDAVYVGDLEGHVHSVDRRTGELNWSKRHATFSIEQPILLHDGVLYFGAWDGKVYAVDAGDGSLKWAVRSPAGQSGGKFVSRYYAAADCAMLVIGDRLFVTDRAYRLGSYSLDGEYLGDIATGVSGIGLSEDGQAFYARGMEAGLTRYDPQGKAVWSNPVKLGRFPIPPTEVGDRVYVCSNRGRLTVHDAATGEIVWRYQVTPQLHVMAPVAADRDGFAVVADMDGGVTRVRCGG